MNSFVVIGLGLFGSSVARQLCALGAEVLAIDIHPELVQQISSDVTNAVVADARDADVLRALGAQECECAVVAIGDDLAGSVLATMNLKELGVRYIVCKAHDEVHRKVLEKLGADKVVIPEKAVADKLARSLTSHNVLDFIELSSDYGIVEIPTPKTWVGKNLKELDVRAKLGVNIIAIQRNGKVSVSPRAEFVIEKNDILVVLGDYDSLTLMQEI
jgi:trk system potassium uptake protein TrkA